MRIFFFIVRLLQELQKNKKLFFCFFLINEKLFHLWLNNKDRYRQIWGISRTPVKSMLNIFFSLQVLRTFFYVISIKLNFHCFSMKTKSLFIVHGTLYFIQSIGLQKLRPLPIFHATNGFQMAVCSENMAGDMRVPNSCPVYIFFTGPTTCGRALSWSKIGLSWRLAYSGRFCFNAWFSFINCCLQRTVVVVSPGFSNS